MNDKLQNASAEAVTQLMGWLKQGGEFVGSQAPDLARQCIAQYSALATLNVAIGLMWIVAAVCGALLVRRSFVRWESAEGLEAKEIPLILTGLVGAILACAGSGIGLKLVSDGAVELIKIHTAPKLFLLVKLAELLK